MAPQLKSRMRLRNRLIITAVVIALLMALWANIRFEAEISLTEAPPIELSERYLSLTPAPLPLQFETKSPKVNKPFASTAEQAQVPKFAKWLENFVTHRLGKEVGLSFFNPEFLRAAKRNPGSFLASPFDSKHDSPYNLPYVSRDGHRSKDVPFPVTLNGSALQLISIKRYASVALQRLVYETEYFDRLLDDPRSTGGLLFQGAAVDALERFVDGLIAQVFQHLQLVFDTADEGLRRALQLYSRRYGLDPLLHVLATIGADTTEEFVHEQLLMKRKPANYFQQIPGVFYDSQQLRTRSQGWSFFHPVLRCFTQVRECEDPDACRFVCNTEYILQYAESENAISGHYLIGGGSDNNFLWELEWMRLFESPGSRNVIAGISTNDCTLQPREKVSIAAASCNSRADCKLARVWFPPQKLTNASVPWMQSSMCLGSHPSGSVTTVAQAYNSLVSATANKRLAEAPNQTLFNGHARKRWTHVSGDNVTILKIDVEFGEYRALGDWLLEDLQAGNLFVSQLQIEVHRLPTESTTLDPSIVAANWWIDYLRLQLLALGFLPISNEKNSFGFCCFEFVFVHHRYFVRSEAWMAASRQT